ncbi:MAG: hypothetical protein IJ880_00550 [Bacilli bacterium]|nr:hypothetical protein [Bacilli bacterium]
MAERNNFKYKYPGYLANNETVTSAKLNSIVSAINTLIENLMNHDHIGVTDSYNQTTRGPKLVGDACLVEKTITTRCLNDEAVTTIKLSSKENNGVAAVDRNNIKDNAVGTNEIENNAIITNKILDKNVTREKLADNAIDFSKIDSTTLDSIYNTMFDMMYPIGSTYITTLSYCPLQKGRWELITTAQSRVLQVASSPDKAGTTIEAGLPNITGSIGDFNGNCNSGTRLGVFKQSYNSNYKYTNSSGSNRHQFIVFNANDGATVKGIYKDDCKTVQPPAFLINIFKRVE